MNNKITTTTNTLLNSLELYLLNFKFENNLLSLISPFSNLSLGGKTGESSSTPTIAQATPTSPTTPTLASVGEFLRTINLFLEDFNLVNHKGYVTLNDNPNPIFPKITKFFNSLGYKGSIATKDRTYQLWVNLIIVNLYFLSILIEKELLQNIDPLLEDSRADLKNLIQKLYSFLDPSIRIKIQKRGVSVIQNIYTGYDSEFVLQDVRKHLNKLVSLQLALNTRTIIKIPLYKPYQISYVHPLTSNITVLSHPDIEAHSSVLRQKKLSEDSNLTEELSTPKTGEKTKELYIKTVELEILEKSIRNTIDQIREVKSKNYDSLLFELIEALQKSPGITYFEDDLKDQIVFALPRTNIIKKFIYPATKDGLHSSHSIIDYSFEYLVKTSNLLANSSLINSYSKFIQELKTTMPSLQIKNQKTEEVDGDILIKNRQRTTFKIGPVSGLNELEVDKLSVSRVKNNYFCSHLTNADLSILSDFKTLKTQLDIVNKSFITLGKPLIIDNSNVYIRDTMLLAPAGNRSLEAIGKLYSMEKVALTTEEKENMDKLLHRDKKRFEEYAQQDAVITLTHALAMEDFNIQLKHVGVPITLSALGRNYVLSKWRESLPNLSSTGGYQISQEILIGNSESVQTPKGLSVIGNTGVYMSYYIANYKGGRNESFMYGGDTNTLWYDYDLISAYTTAMANLGLPSYSESSLLLQSDIEKWDLEKYLNNYILIKGAFNFPKNTKFPSIPCYLDSKGNATVYPLNGQCFLTGPEYFLCKLQGCDIKIESIFNTPYKKVTEKIGVISTTKILKPFYSIIKELQRLRKEYPKGDIMNLLYKEMGNSIYGNIVRGIADKRKFDIKTGKNLRIDSTELSNPILASITTGFIRSVIGECLHNINKLGGKVLSVTTDGFITDVKDLETKLLNLNSSETPLFRTYRAIRESLSGNSTALEIKHSGKGILSWTTRGQMGIESKIKATTGFQSFGYSKDELISYFKKILSSKDKYFEYTQSSLRGANEIYKKGGHVTMTYKTQIFRLLYDNRRLIIEPENFNSYDLSNCLLDSKPFNSVEECARIRFISKIQRSSNYNINTSLNTAKRNGYTNFLEMAVKNFIKGYLNKEPLFGLQGNEFKNYKELKEFIRAYEPAKHIQISSQSISNLKHRKMIFKPVIKRKETLDFIAYVKTKIKSFNENEFFK